VITQIGKEKLAKGLLAAQVPHPFDTHPTLAQRAAALGVNARQIIQQALSDLLERRDASVEMVSLEEEVTAVENELARRPGGTLRINDQPLGEPPPPAGAEPASPNRTA
jgi:hypothetical protein